jgi:flagellar protein FlaG
MLVKPLAGSGNSLSPSVQTKLTADQAETQRNDQVNKAVKKPDLSGLDELELEVKKNLNIMHDVDLHFKVHKSSGRIVVTVTDRSTGEVIREIPSSELLAFTEKFDKIVGMIFEENT